MGRVPGRPGCPDRNVCIQFLPGYPHRNSCTVYTVYACLVLALANLAVKESSIWESAYQLKSFGWNVRKTGTLLDLGTFPRHCKRACFLLLLFNSMQSHPWFLLMFSTPWERNARPLYLLVLGEYVESRDAWDTSRHDVLGRATPQPPGSLVKTFCFALRTGLKHRMTAGFLHNTSVFLMPWMWSVAHLEQTSCASEALIWDGVDKTTHQEQRGSTFNWKIQHPCIVFQKKMMCSTARQANIDWIAFHHVPSAQWKQEGRLGATLLQLHAQNCTISWTGAQQEMMPTICIDSGNREHLPTAKWWTSVLSSRGNWAVLNTSRKRRVALTHHGFVRENLSQHHVSELF